MALPQITKGDKSYSAANTRYAFPAYRVFIYGKEVTDDITVVQITNTDSRSPNRCTLSLVNPLDKYIITAKDMLHINRFQAAAGPGLPVTDIKQLPAAVAAAVEFLPNTTDPIGDADCGTRYIKSSVINSKMGVTFFGPIDADDIFTGDRTAKPKQYGNIMRYPFQQGKAIFHANDHVTVWERDPFDPSTWYWAFRGLLSDCDDTSDHNNEQRLTITAEASTKLLRYQRLTTNPGITDADAVAAAQTDVILPQLGGANPFSQFSIADIFFTIIFGADATGTIQQFVKDPPGTFTQDGKSKNIFRFEGCGHYNFKESRLFYYGGSRTSKFSNIGAQLPNPEQATSLADYQSVLDHRVKLSDLTSMKDPNIQVDTDNITTIDDAITLIGTRPDAYPVDGGRLIMLLPADLGQDSNKFLEVDPVDNFAMTTEWTTRGNILYSVAERLMFSFYCSPKGDLIVEFPLVDFDPSDFKSSNSALSRTTGARDYEADYTIAEDEIINFSSVQSDDKATTQVTCSSSLIQNLDQTGFSVQLGEQVVVTLWPLLPLYGVRSQPITPMGYLATPDAARIYAHIKLNYMNSDVYSIKTGILPRLQCWLNRPMLHAPRNHIATTTSFTHTITWPQGMTTSVEFFYARGWNGQIDADGKLIYTTIGGSASQPFNYKILLANAKALQGSLGDTIDSKGAGRTLLNPVR